MDGRTNSEHCLTPLEHSLPHIKPGANNKRADPTLYRELMGSLNHLAIFTCPDISLAVSKLSQFNQDANLTHLNVARRILKYAISTKHFTIKYGGNENNHGDIRIDGYEDADWGSDLTQRKSTAGCIFMMNGGPISWTYQQWRPSIWPYPMPHANYWLTSHSSTPSPWKSRIQRFLPITKLPKPL
jgi:hypothetical protein